MVISLLQFADFVKRSQLVEPSDVDDVVADLSATREPSAANVAERLVSSGKLTKFQAKLLLSGKHRGFIIKDKYKILDQVGSGGMGKVFLCEHLILRRRVALKTLNSSQLSDPSAVDRFMREARAIAALDDPNIIRVYDVERDGPSPLMVMEYVDGESLYDMVNSKGPLPVYQAALYISQTAQGLQHAGDVGIVHRDIKPSNLLVDKQGVVKILDMGLARFREPEAADELTKKFDADSVLGTADFLAPEQAVDSTNVDGRADIYALGGTFHFLLTGKPPFEAPTVAEKLLAHQMKPPPSIDHVPVEVERIIRQMMAKKPDDRFQQPLEIVEALQPWLRESVPAARDAAETAPVRKSTTDTKMPKKARSTKQARYAKKTKPRNMLPIMIGGGIAVVAIIVGIAIAMSGGSKPTPSVASSPEPSPNEPVTKKPPPPKKEPAAAKDAFPLIAAASAGKHQGEAVTVRFEVLGTGHPKSRTVFFLNSATNFKDPANFTVVLPRSVVEKLFPQTDFDSLDAKVKGKTVTVRGTITEFGGKPQIEIREADQLKIAD